MAIRSVYILCVFLSVCCYAQKPTSLLASAQQKLTQKDFTGALKDLNDYLITDSLNSSSYILKSECHYKLWQIPEALLNINRSIQLDSLNDKSYVQRAEIQRTIFQYPKALDDVYKAIKINPNNSKVYAIRGRIKETKFFMSNPDQRDTTEIRDMFADYKHSYSLDSNDATTLNYLGNLYFSGKYYKSADKYYSKSLKVDPKNAMTYYERSFVKKGLGDTYTAMTDISTAISLEPSNENLYERRANLYQEIGETERADKDYYMASYIPSKRYFDLGAQSDSIGDYQAAIKYYSRCLDFTSDLAEAYFNRGLSKNHIKDYFSAIEDFKKSKDLNPALSDLAYSNMGLAKYYSQDYMAAIYDCSSAIKLNKKLASAYINRALSKKALGLDFCEDAKKAKKLGSENGKEFYSKYCK